MSVTGCRTLIHGQCGEVASVRVYFIVIRQRHLLIMIRSSKLLIMHINWLEYIVMLKVTVSFVTSNLFTKADVTLLDILLSSSGKVILGTFACYLISVLLLIHNV